jgi:hypothetical protein
MTNVSDHSRLGRRPARIALSLAVAGAMVAVPVASWLPVAQSRAGVLCAHPTPTETPTETPPPPFTASEPTSTPARTADNSERFVSLTAAKDMVKTGGTVTMTGSLSSDDGTCIPDERVEIMATTLGTEEERRAARAVTDAEGMFTATVKVGAGAVYTAVVAETKDAPGATSTPITVLCKVVMSARTRNLSPERGTKIEIGAQVKPSHKGSYAVLQRKKETRWFNIKRDKADDSGFKFKLEAKWKGKRVFRVTWIKSDEDHEPASSNRLKIKTKEPKEGGGRRNRS